jgi:branched-chain amino acid transport system permease protein
VLSVSFWAFVGVIAGIYTIFALGLQLQVGFAGLPNFGHVASMALAAYTMAILVVKVGLDMWLSVPIALAAAVVFGGMICAPAARLGSDFLAIATLTLAEVIRYLAVNLSSLTGGAQGTIYLKGPASATFFDADWIFARKAVQRWLSHVAGRPAPPDVAMLVIVWILAIVLVALVEVAVRSPWGRVVRAIRDDETVAACLGKPVLRYKLQVLCIGGALGGAAGLLYAWELSVFSPDDFLPLNTLYAFVIILLGGVAKNWGVPLGALVFGVIFAGTRFFDFAPFTWLGSADRAYLRLTIVGLLLIGLIAFRPQGVLGSRAETLVD